MTAHRYTTDTCHLLYLACSECRIWLEERLPEHPDALMLLSRLMAAERAALAESGPDPESLALARYRATKYLEKQ